MALAIKDAQFKRKRRKLDHHDKLGTGKTELKRRKKTLVDGNEKIVPVSDISRLELEIKESQKNYNNIATLLNLAANGKDDKSQVSAITSLCRVSCRLLAEGRLSTSNCNTESEEIITEWLNGKFGEYKQILMDRLESSETSSRLWVLPLCMALSKEEVLSSKSSKAIKSNPASVWKSGVFGTMLDMILWTSDNRKVCEAFIENYAQPYNDIRHVTFLIITETLREGKTSRRNNNQAIENSVFLLSTLEPADQASVELNKLFCELDAPQDKPIRYRDHRKEAQKAWLATLNSGLNKDQRKLVLNIMRDKIVPWFSNTELLMDFLTDSYNVGGATSLLSLSGLFYLIQTKNLDYPDFYKKLYSLLDHQLLHSKHRSRFFRLMNTFMSSTHLPAAMVASFIKRLSRLALHAPAGGIVAVVPWIYNMLKAHPTCTFMIHREPRTKEEREQYTMYGMQDPFKMDETDPMLTDALDSCVWELVTLQSHYHPNVASLAKIISQQFTKKEYNIEDFLDHSYGSLIDAELGKAIKKTPVVEFEIPKKIFIDPNGDTTLEILIERVLENSKE